jgi:hypothetical protein
MGFVFALGPRFRGDERLNYGAACRARSIAALSSPP